MKFGAWIPSFSRHKMDYSEAEGIRDYARKAEALEFDGVWVIDHLLHAPGLYGVSWLEPLSVLSHVAAVTNRIRIGTSILVLPLRNPVLLAKTIATMDFLAGGRYVFGIGPGWYEREFEVTGTHISERGARTDEVLDAVRLLLTQENASFEGKYYRFEDVTIDPLPPKMPEVWVAGGSRIRTDLSPDKTTIAQSVLRRVARCDAFVVRNTGYQEWVVRDMQAARECVASVGRDPEGLLLAHVQFTHIVETADRKKALEIQRPHFEFAMGAHRDWNHLQACYLTGTIDDMCEKIEALRKVGLQYLIIHPTSTEPDQIDFIAKHLFPPFKD
ncbi:MAG: LLM class flavin-dependent oxidoreductase [Nitrospinota bacterium]